MEGFKISTDPKVLDLDLIHEFISQSYWAKGVPRETLEISISNSLVFGVYRTSGEQVGFARVITDKSTFAYLGDVFVLDSCRGIGVAKLLMEAVVSHPDLQGLRRFMLATRDAHNLYAKFGFQSVDNPDTLMQILQPDIYA